MNDNLEIELILKRKRYPKIYNTPLILLLILAIIIYSLFTYKYISYLTLDGIVINDMIEISISIDDLKYLNNNNSLLINNNLYTYKIISIKDIDNYKKVYIYIDNINYIENNSYKIKVKKSNQTLAKYLKEYMKGE